MPEDIVQLCLKDWGLYSAYQMLAAVVLGFIAGAVNEVRRAKRRQRRERDQSNKPRSD